MPFLRRRLFALLLVVSTGPSLAHAASIDLGYLVFTDRGELPVIEVYNITDTVDELAPGGEFLDLVLEAFDQADVSLGTVPRTSLAPGFTPWLADLDLANPFFGQIARITLALTFGGQRVAATVQTCVPGDDSDGCIVEFLEAPIGEDVDCETEMQRCVPMRSGAALLTYQVPVPQPVPAPAPLVLIVCGGLAALWRRQSRS